MSVIYTPNIVISKNYSFMNNFMEGKYFSDLDSATADDAVIFNGKQNRYVYSLEHSFNYNQSDTEITLKILDADGNFDNTFFNETFYQRLMNNSVNKYLRDTKEVNSKTKISDFEKYVNDYLQSQIKIYLAYGIGDDLNTWTDPIACTLVAADVDVANNGLRSYTYKFIPQINNFFRPEPEKDKNDPNRDVDFEFGSLTARTDYTINTTDLLDINSNITKLLRGFTGKICNVKPGNVIAVIPDLKPKPVTVTIIPKGADITDGTTNPYETIQLNWNGSGATTNIGEVKSPYKETFKSIEAVYTGSRVLPVTKTITVTKYRQKQDVVVALNKELEKIRRNYGDIKVKDESELKRIVYNELVSARWSYNQLSAELNRKLQSGMTRDQLTEYIDRSEELQEGIKNLEQSLASQEARVEAAEKAENYKKLLQSPTFPQENYFEQETRIVNENQPASLKLTMYAEAESSNKQNQDKPTLPNWRQAINLVFQGMTHLTEVKDPYIVPHLSFETNLRWLKLFKKYGLIEDETQPCLIVGDRQMVLEYLYCNQVPLTNIQDIQSNLKLPANSPLLTAHNNGYLTDLKDLVFRKRNSSSFSEKIYLDELDLSNGNTASQSNRSVAGNAANELDLMTKEYDIPIFINNFRNSNVISYSLKNSENYIAALKFAVRDNRLKYLLSEFNDDVYIQLFKDAGIKDPVGNLNPIELAKIYFNKTVKLLPKEIQDRKYESIRQDEIQLVEDWVKKSDQNLFKNKYAEFVAGAIYEWYPKSDVLRDEPFSIDDMERRTPSKTEKLPLKLAHNLKNVSYINLALQKTLYDTYGSKIDENELASVAELIVLLNAEKNVNGGETLSFIPGITLPNTGFILSKLNEYQHRYATQLTIKTLPFFNLTDSRTLLKPAIFYSKRVSIVNPNEAPDISFDYFSGEYRIVGFKHIINTQECYSEFMMIKYQASDENLKGHT